MTEEQREWLRRLPAFFWAEAEAIRDMIEGDAEADDCDKHADAIDAAIAEIDRQAKRIDRLESLCRYCIDRMRYTDSMPVRDTLEGRD